MSLSPALDKAKKPENLEKLYVRMAQVYSRLQGFNKARKIGAPLPSMGEAALRNELKGLERRIRATRAAHLERLGIASSGQGFSTSTSARSAQRRAIIPTPAPSKSRRQTAAQSLDPRATVDPNGRWSLQKFLVAGDGHASDLEYEGGLLGLDDATNRWFGHFGDEQKWALPTATLGAIPYAPVSKKYTRRKAKELGLRAPKFGGKERKFVSIPRYKEILAQDPIAKARWGKAADIFKKAITRDISPFKLPKGVPLGARAFETSPMLAWFLLVEAAAAARAGAATAREPNGAPIDLLVNG